MMTMGFLPFFQMETMLLVPTDTPLRCILCNVAWLIYRLPDQEVWLQGGTLAGFFSAIISLNGLKFTMSI
jgi:hypothetical protein